MNLSPPASHVFGFSYFKIDKHLLNEFYSVDSGFETIFLLHVADVEIIILEKGLL